VNLVLQEKVLGETLEQSAVCSFCVKSRTNSIFTDNSLISRIFFIKTSRKRAKISCFLLKNHSKTEVCGIGVFRNGHLELMRQILADYDEELDGDNAALYDALWDAFEEVKVDG
jgi:hypothetical protein